MTLRQIVGAAPHSDENNSSEHRSLLARRFLQLALVLLVVGLVPGLLALWSQRRAAAAVVWRDPADNIQVTAVAPDLALLSLAGVPDDAILALAMEKGELGTVHALLALSGGLRDARRVNGWLWLAHRYREAEQGQQAVQAYHLAGTGAIMGTNVPDMLRAETLLAAGEGLIELHDRASARFFIQQAAVIAANSTNFTPFHRHSLLERLVPASLLAGGEREDWKALAQAVKNGKTQGVNLDDSGFEARYEWWNLPPLDDAELVAARDERRSAAAEYLQTLLDTSTTVDDAAQDSSQSNAAQALRSALLAEGAAVERYVARQRETQTTEKGAQQILLNWLLLKRRVAAGGFGAGLVPEWESSRKGIDAALTDAWADWLAVQTDSTSAALGGNFQVPPSGAARQATIAAFWGLYPDAPVDDLVSSNQSTPGFGRLRLTMLEPGTPPLVGWSE
jgi:hypothetical protein